MHLGRQRRDQVEWLQILSLQKRPFEWEREGERVGRPFERSERERREREGVRGRGRVREEDHRPLSTSSQLMGLSLNPHSSSSSVKSSSVPGLAFGVWGSNPWSPSSSFLVNLWASP